MKGWVGLLSRPVADGLPVSCRSSAGQEKFAGYRPTFYHCTNYHATKCWRNLLEFWSRYTLPLLFIDLSPKMTDFTLILTDMIKPVKNKYDSNSSYKVWSWWAQRSVPKWLRQQGATGSSNMAAQTGNTSISGTTIDSIEIPTGNLVFSSMSSL